MSREALSEPRCKTWLVYVLPPEELPIMIGVCRHQEPKTAREILAIYSAFKDAYDMMVLPDDGHATVHA